MASHSYTQGAPKKEDYESSPAYMAKVLGIKSVKLSNPVPKPVGKRKTPATVVDNDDDDNDCYSKDVDADMKTPAKKPRKKAGDEPEEKRVKRFRAKAPISYNERLERAKSQRMFMIDRNRTISADGTHEEEVFDMAGSTGNIYQVTISKVPSCTCPDSMKGNQCKHIVYVLVNILKAREDLAYQLAFLTTELAEIFANAPVTPQSSDASKLSTDTGGSRKPVEGDCPVCVMEFEEGEDIVWCKAACGNNVHRHCFEQWARSKPGPVKCVYCRSAWKGDEESIEKISKSGGTVGADGYVNVAGELGLSGERDMSTYHPPWVNRQFGRGYGRYGYDY